MAARLLRRLRGQRGFTLVELIAVLGILMTVVTAITVLFVSGAKAELDANERFEAQQNARIALDKLRRELHCSSGITNVDDTPLTTTPVAAIKVSLPGHCPSASGATTFIVYQAVSAGASRWTLRRTQGGVAVDVAEHFTNDDVFTYTAQTPETRATLHVDLPINVNPNEGWPTWRLVDDIVLRNTLRETP